jgi:hypothetical protein
METVEEPDSPGDVAAHLDRCTKQVRITHSLARRCPEKKREHSRLAVPNPELLRTGLRSHFAHAQCRRPAAE